MPKTTNTIKKLEEIFSKHKNDIICVLVTGKASGIGFGTKENILLFHFQEEKIT